ncbi:MAG: hypothetical protein PHE32_03010 [Candidatus Shapirobacteria bacterium]|nr:hypothetical protein [Candidatus Shapirobacteria bacterium]MDD4410642.1 hypothetical protein [Candidatus Shapirobacteria bacterium]
MKKNFFIPIMIITLVGIGAGITLTRAFFSARKTTSGSKFTAGTLDLAIGQGISDPFVVENIGAEGNISGGKTWTIRNTGSLPGRLYMKLTNLKNISSGCINEPKTLADPLCAETNHEGNLGKVVKTKITLDGVDVITNNTLSTADQDKYGTQWNNLTPVIIPAGGSKTVALNWSASQDDYGNEIQGDNTQFDIEYNLVQLDAAVSPTVTP